MLFIVVMFLTVLISLSTSTLCINEQTVKMKVIINVYLLAKLIYQTENDTATKESFNVCCSLECPKKIYLFKFWNLVHNFSFRRRGQCILCLHSSYKWAGRWGLFWIVCWNYINISTPLFCFHTMAVHNVYFSYK